MQKQAQRRGRCKVVAASVAMVTRDEAESGQSQDRDITSPEPHVLYRRHLSGSARSPCEGNMLIWCGISKHDLKASYYVCAYDQGRQGAGATLPRATFLASRTTLVRPNVKEGSRHDCQPPSLLSLLCGLCGFVLRVSPRLSATSAVNSLDVLRHARGPGSGDQRGEREQDGHPQPPRERRTLDLALGAVLLCGIALPEADARSHDQQTNDPEQPVD